MRRGVHRHDRSYLIGRHTEGVAYEEGQWHGNATPAVTGQEGVTKGRPDLREVDTEAPDYLQEAAVPLSSETHSGVDGPVYARGPAAHLLHGVQEQSYLYYVMVHALRWDAKPKKSPAGK